MIEKPISPKAGFNIITTSRANITSDSPIIYKDLWNNNSPLYFWQTKLQIDHQLWHEAIFNSMNANNLPSDAENMDEFLYLTLGEGRFGDNHWNLSMLNRFYWFIKPTLPKFVVKKVRSAVNKARVELSKQNWPIDDRYVQFQWEILRQILILSGVSSILFKSFWPRPYQYALVLTHDVESVEGQSYIPIVADLEEAMGFRSSFNIVSEQIPKDLGMLQEMKLRGFEIGVHGWRHDETAYLSHANFMNSAKHINESLVKLDAVGYRNPLNLRNPEWMQSLNIEYDLSFFDTDPFEPMAGGAMSIWPFMIGHFMELPATLVQDNTLVNLLGERTPQVWLDKVDFLRHYHGMALLNSHPDYLISKTVWDVYSQFLDAMVEEKTCWKALPRDAARWWKLRMENAGIEEHPLEQGFSEARLTEEMQLIID